MGALGLSHYSHEMYPIAKEEIMDVYTCGLCGAQDTLISTTNELNGKGSRICRDYHTHQAAIANAARMCETNSAMATMEKKSILEVLNLPA